ncbi:adhesion G-protein coupled receptor G2-like [Bolinopsis microptera]|uniref:adhesion G-protein coupled receptor G2-like n=1 Tax=Bolinopsis microptera TaxID=2820187 RepID=UPI00307AC1A5
MGCSVCALTTPALLSLCLKHSFTKCFQSAYEIDRGFAEVQSYLTYVLLGISIVSLILTLVFLLPAKALRSTRSAKINICFTTALLLASLMFLIQDAFISADDTGVIKLKSTGCAVYAMIQHYLWLVVFAWMVVEGFLMYLSLVQVFGSHISKCMLKFNLAAWGIPLPIPFIGYFVFTKRHTVGSFTFTEHGYLADTMCFIRPESTSFYTLFLAPIVLVILVNLFYYLTLSFCLIK